MVERAEGGDVVSEWPFGNLNPMSYDLILADPATRFETWSTAGDSKSPQAQYDTMTWDELAELKVHRLARGDAFLVMWACWPTIMQSHKLLEDWGFRYVTGGAWHKRTKHGKTAFGTGYVLRSACEPFLIGKIGNPKASKSVRNIIDAEARGHSRKPDDQYELCERLAPHAVKFVELFARQHRAGWDAWGNEVNKFEVEAQ